jgi:hypothetical protein
MPVDALLDSALSARILPHQGARQCSEGAAEQALSQHAGDGDHPDGGNLLLRIRSERLSNKGARLPAMCAWVFRYSPPSGGRRREMGLGVALRGTTAQAGESLTAARDAAHRAREQLRANIDPIEARDGHREALRQAEAKKKAEIIVSAGHWRAQRATITSASSSRRRRRSMSAPIQY